MKVLVVGSGGREHALCWKLRQSPQLAELYCAPGNPGIGEFADRVPLAAEEVHELAEFAQDLGIDLTVVGPELPLTLGIADEFARRGLLLFGPSQKAAELEGSKAFAKRFMRRHGIPTAEFEIVHNREEAATTALRFGLPVVLKADGLAAGKGVMIATDGEELEEALEAYFQERRFGSSADRLVVERYLEGVEISFMALSDGAHLLPLATSKDYKRLGDGDEGPNTGGMGAHSPSGVVSTEMARQIMDRVMRPAVAGMAEDNRHFQGVLYAGMILTSQGPQVLEFNVRFGDPEGQAILVRMEDDLLPVLMAGAAGSFGTSRLHFRKEAAACLVLASRGYPGTPVKGEVITGIERAAAMRGVEVFHAGTATRDEVVLSAGGRVLNVVASGANLRDALRRAYLAAAEIDWPSKTMRSDIGRAVLDPSLAER